MAKPIESQFEFVARYEVEQLERIERHGVERFLQFAGATPLHSQQELAAGPILRVRPAESEAWVGVFRKGSYGYPTRPDAPYPFCPQCGRPMVWACPKCGALLPEDSAELLAARFCRECGTGYFGETASAAAK